jgi:hypothetical protein
MLKISEESEVVPENPVSALLTGQTKKAPGQIAPGLTGKTERGEG